MTDDAPGLFDVPELSALPNAGRAEAGLLLALRAAERDQVVQDLDGGLVAGALVAARALDRAEALPDKTAVYAVAQLLPPYQKALHGLGLPLERMPAGGPTVPVPGQQGAGAPDWLGDHLGPT